MGHTLAPVRHASVVPLTGELSPFQRWQLRFSSDVHPWPTQILDDTVLLVLRHLAICETENTYPQVSALPFSLSLSPSVFFSFRDTSLMPLPLSQTHVNTPHWFVNSAAHG